MDVLIVGSGGREHALAWKLAQSSRIGKLYIAPGNGGTGSVGENVPILATDIAKLAQFADEKKIGLTVVGPDDPLALGIVDLFKARGLRIFGPTKAAAQLESSKTFSKQFMQDEKIPTAPFRVFTEYEPAIAHVRVHGAPVVIKAGGLALGKGAYVCMTMEEAKAALKEIMIDRVHGEAGSKVIVEDYLEGPEVSVHAFSDGISYMMFPPAQDHKPALDGDKGKNTGGMGTIAPVHVASAEFMQSVERTIIRPTLAGMRLRDALFTGLLYPGLKITIDSPNVLEYNARFGDPETQVYMRLMKSDLLDVLEACADMNLDAVAKNVEWNRGFAANVVLASGGYPDAYQTGFSISGLDDASKVPGVVVFHAGTTYDGGTYKTAGGRVLGVSAIGFSLKEALAAAYKAVELIHFEGMHYRRDIGAKSI